jgi:hypothetical protein
VVLKELREVPVVAKVIIMISTNKDSQPII